jgi:hypothetical protein
MGSSEGQSPFDGGFGGLSGAYRRISPNSKVPQEWGIKGVEKTFVNALNKISLTYHLDSMV